MHKKTSGIQMALTTALAAGIMYQTYNAASWLYNNLSNIAHPQYTSYTHPIFLTGAFVLGHSTVNAFKNNSALSQYLAGGTSSTLLYAFSAITYSYLNYNFGGNNPLISSLIGVGTIACSSLVWSTAFENGINPVLKIGADMLDKVIGFISETTGLNLSNHQSFTASVESRKHLTFSFRS